jgi:cellulose synthase/poly-beta-1,6-N-acetylglucosamine synthase-like glycosyltransferase/peptidoglycan/xylan/chitin deacetylase (PgdA/CDA1 family)
MSTILVDPSLRRARYVRVVFAILVAAIVTVLAVFGYGLRASAHPAPSLPSPRRAVARSPRRPGGGQRRPLLVRDPAAGQPRARRAAVARASFPRPDVIAFVDPMVNGALVSLDRHADAIAEVATTGLVLDDGEALVDRIDPAVVEVARSHQLKLSAVVQNVDADGGWRGDRVAKIVSDARARDQLAEAIDSASAVHGLAGVHLDLEALDDATWAQLPALVGVVAARLHPRGLDVAVEVPADLDGAVLAALGRVADRVVVMAYDEHEERSEPGPIASESFVEEAATRLAAVTPARSTMGLGIYGYDWVEGRAAEPLSFVDALTAAKEARVTPEWIDGQGLRIRYSDEEGVHDVRLLDGATLWNQLQLVAKVGISSVALWRLGGEDPGVWRLLEAWDRGAAEATAPLSTVAPDDRVMNVGAGAFLSLALSPEEGRRELVLDGERVINERWQRLPSPFLVRRAGTVDGKVALTFDDGPAEPYTSAILDVLRAEGAPATFFVVGTRAQAAPELVQRAFAEGHTIGNHTFTHPNVDAVDDGRLRLELELTSRLVETLVGRRPLLYRPPSLSDLLPHTTEEARAFARNGSLGYLIADVDVDSQDWMNPDEERLVESVVERAQDGGVILMHDGGGDRSLTVRALPRIIARLRARGAQIVPLASLIGKSRDDVMPIAQARSTVVTAAEHAVFRSASWIVTGAAVCLTAGLVLVGARALVIIGLALTALRRQRRRRGPPVVPPVTVIVPAFNEGAVIVRTVESVLASDVPVDVIVVDDGSTDGTGEQVRARFQNDRRVRLISQANAGKAAALRVGFAAARTEVVVALDGDTLFERDTVRRLAAPFADPRVGAVAGTADVGNVGNALTRLQALEYLIQQEVERRAWDALAALPVVPGAVGAWRRRAVAEVGGFSSATLAEDADLAMALCRGGWRVVYEPAARARTEVPETVRALVRQRVRWSFGVLQAMWKHRRALVEPHAGSFGRLVLPWMIVFQVLLPLVTPAAMVAALAALIVGSFGPALVASVVLLVTEALQAVLACRLGGRGWRLLPWLLVARIVYRPLLLGVLVRSLLRTLDGVPLGWNKLPRRGTVTP